MRFLIKLAIVGAIAWGAWTYFQRPACGRSGAVACPPAALEEGVGVELSRAEVCPGAGYFCHELRGDFPVARWTLEKGKLKVRIPLPDFADAEYARELQDAAVEGVMGWDGHPFPLLIDTGKRTPLFGYDIGVHWHQGQGGGHARVGLNVRGKRLDYSIDGLQVQVPPIRQDLPDNMSPEQAMEVALAAMKSGGIGTMSRDQVLALVQATASHEMGHALGLMHSDSERDIMFPRYTPGSTPAAPSGRDLRTVEALYSMPNGASLR